MSGVAVAHGLTVAEFMELDLPRGAQLIEGEVVVSSPSFRHQGIERDLVVALALWCRAAEGRGEVVSKLGSALDERSYYEPDVCWYRDGRIPDGDRPVYPLPDLASEIRSPSTWRYDIGPKKARYEQHGLPELWLVDSAADEILIYRRSRPVAQTFDVCLELARSDALTSPLLPGFALDLDELFGPR